MERIAIFQFGYETNTFSAGLAELAALGTGGWTPREEVLSLFRGKRAGMSGAIAALEELGAVPVPLDSLSRAGAFNAGPTISDDAAEAVIDHICEGLRRHADEYDGVFYAMHGAGHSESIDDLDGYYLRRIRAIIGSKPLTASLDLHANMTAEMLRYADGLFGIKTNPHVDFYDASALAVRVLADILRGKYRPKMALVKLPLLVSIAVANTLEGPCAEIKDRFAAYAREHDLLDATFFHAFQGTDGPEATAAVLTVARDHEPVREAEELADFVWRRRKGLNAEGFSAAEALDAALARVRDGYAVICDGPDNPGSGCPGDGTHLLREFLRRDLPRCIMGPLADAEAAAVCHRHQVGDRFPLRFGGKHLPIFGEPLELPEVELLALSDGKFTCVSPVHRGAAMDHGPSARLRCGQVEFILVSNRFQTYDDQPFRMLGADLRDYRIVGLKSVNHFRAFFKDTADAIVCADTPSTCPGDLRKLDYRRVPRPVYPLDEDTEFFSRP